jgi:hypothetical protein
LINAMPQLSEWLQIMLGEIARKQDEARRAKEEPPKAEDLPKKEQQQRKLDLSAATDSIEKPINQRTS